MGDLIATLLSFLLTVAILSYIWRDNPIFRLALHLFIGVAAGYAAAVTVNNVLYPRLVTPFFSGDLLSAIVLSFPPFILGLLLLAKLSRRFAWVGNPSMAFLVGVGAAASLGGAVLGTLFPQIQASIDVVSLQGLLILVGTVLTLLYFQFSLRADPEQPPQPNRLLQVLGWGGQVFIAVTFGVIFAGVYSSALSALIERWAFLLGFVTGGP